MIEVRDVRFSYDGERDVLRGVSLDIEDGEFLCVLGGNGSGKSTLAKHLNALLMPDGGSVSVGGMDTADPANLYDIRSRVGMVFQNPDDQLVATLVEDDVAFGPENLGMPPAQIAQHVRAALEGVGLAGFERHETHALSGGQKQRVAIAGVLAMEPHVIVLDEATSMLDPRGRAGLMRAAHELNARGMTVVMITHYMEEAAEADRIVVLDGGKVALEGAPCEVFAHADVLARLNLDVPPAQQLAIALGERRLKLPAVIGEDELIEAVAGRIGAARAGMADLTPSREAANDAPAASDTVSPCFVDADADVAREDDGAQFAADESRPSLDRAPVLISLKNVWFSYSVSARERRRTERRGAVAAVGKKRAKWGNDPASAWALQDVSLDIHQGEFLGIAGHTGSGKSTLVRLLNGLAQPTMGRVLVCGEDLASRAAQRGIASKVGVVFQYPERQLFASTVAEDVAFGPRNLGLPQDEADRRVRDALERVGLPAGIAAMSPFELSGGQQRRVAFAGVLAMEPQVLVLDEPAAGLDPAARRSFLSLVADLHAQGLTVVMVSHSMDDLARLCDRVVVLNEGKVCRAGAPAQVFMDAAALKRVGLAQPAAERLACKLREHGVVLDMKRLYTVDTLADALVNLGGAAVAEGGERA